MIMQVTREMCVTRIDQLKTSLASALKQVDSLSGALAEVESVLRVIDAPEPIQEQVTQEVPSLNTSQ